MSAKRKAPCPKPQRPTGTAVIDVPSSSSEDEEETTSAKKRAYHEVREHNTQTLDETTDDQSAGEECEPQEITIAKSKHLLPKSASL